MPENRQRRREAEEADKVRCDYTWGDRSRRKHETFYSCYVDWTDPRTPQAASAAPIRMTGKPKNTVLL